MKIALFGDSLTAGYPGSSYYLLLRERFPDYSIFNLGKPNETVVSLRRRIASMAFEDEVDIAFIWIGVNDVNLVDSWSYRTFHSLIGQRRAKDGGEFGSCLREILKLVDGHARRVIVAPPGLKGEILDNPGNRRISFLVNIVREITYTFEKAEYLDLHAVFLQELKASSSSGYLRRNPLNVLSDTLTLRDDERIDKKAAERGLRVTLDGVHLNSRGAELVADALAKQINGHVI